MFVERKKKNKLRSFQIPNKTHFPHKHKLGNVDHQFATQRPPIVLVVRSIPASSNMQAMPDARQQSFEEIYGPPENFLEIEVSLAPLIPP